MYRHVSRLPNHTTSWPVPLGTQVRYHLGGPFREVIECFETSEFGIVDEKMLRLKDLSGRTYILPYSCLRIVAAIRYPDCKCVGG